MTAPAQPRRPYRSPRRAEQAQDTRARILEAAEALYVEHGFAGTTVAAIAESAGVAQETVYQAFGNKRALLAALVRRAVRGDDPAPVLEQAGPRAVGESTDPAEQLALFADDVARRLARVGPIMQVLAEAARAEPELAELHRQLHQARQRNLRAFIDAVAGNAPLRTGRRAAAETVWALASPELHTLLTRTAGWSHRRYTTWLADALAGLLLARPAG